MTTIKPTHYICFETFTVKSFSEVAKPAKKKKRTNKTFYELRIVIDGNVDFYKLTQDSKLTQDLIYIAQEYKYSDDPDKYIEVVKMKDFERIEEFELDEPLPNKRIEAKKQLFIALLK
tara:strand:- start:3406 stop:3759 length:354 start_codon:yes stop_codon:yes gene_type:complete